MTDDAPLTNLDRAVDRMLADLARIPDLPGYARQGKTFAAALSASTDDTPDGPGRVQLAALTAVIASTADVALEVHRLNQMKENT